MNSSPGRDFPELILETAYGRVTILGNARTFRGFIQVLAPDGVAISISKADITGGSDTALAWVDGFLAGNEPPLSEYLGVTDIEAECADDEVVEEWLAAIATFRETGNPPAGMGKAPSVPPPALLATPWALGQGKRWQWTSGAWHPMADEPMPEGEVWPGAICDEREHHTMAVIEEQIVCEDCGYVAGPLRRPCDEEVQHGGSARTVSADRV